MAYKITKYKGKTKLKDTKTGKSVEINIGELMQGKKPVRKYRLGGASTICPPGDWKCEEEQRQLALDNKGQSFSKNDGNLQADQYQVGDIHVPTAIQQREGQQANTNRNLPDLPQNQGTTPTQASRPRVSTAMSDELSERKHVIDAPMGDLGPQAPQLTEEDMVLNKDKGIGDPAPPPPNYNIYNPYGGMDLATASNQLGKSIKNKNTFGIATSGLKLATGLGRNLVAGMGAANRAQHIKKEQRRKEQYKEGRITYNAHGGMLPKYMAEGGKLDKQFMTGEFMQGVQDEGTQEFNAEVEDGEYLKTGEGDVAEVVGDKHTEGGEKIQMTEEDKILSDQLKLGAKVAKTLSEKYDLKLGAKDTYSKVLDKYRSKSKLNKLIEEEAEILEKVGEQQKVEDENTRNFNLQVLAEKQDEIAKKKHPLEEVRKEMFEELFSIQESTKPKSKQVPRQDTLAEGGKLESLSKEYGVPIDRIHQIIGEHNKVVPKYDGGGTGCPKGQEPDGKGGCRPKTRYGVEKTEEEYNEALKNGYSVYDADNNIARRTTPGVRGTFNKGKTVSDEVGYARRDKKQYPTRDSYNKGKAEYWARKRAEAEQATHDTFDYINYRDQNPDIDFKLDPFSINDFEDEYVDEIDDADDPTAPEDKKKKRGRLGRNGMPQMGGMLFPDTDPMFPEALQGTMKAERRFDRVTPSEIEAEPYLQDIRDREAAQEASLEGLSPNVRAAALANMRANSQKQEMDMRNRIDAANIQSEEKAIYRNADIQRMEENASMDDRLKYEQRNYMAQALTRRDEDDYLTQMQQNNKQKYMDIHNLNLVNATNEDVYFDGQQYQRKTSDRELYNRAGANAMRNAGNKNAIRTESEKRKKRLAKKAKERKVKSKKSK